MGDSLLEQLRNRSRSLGEGQTLSEAGAIKRGSLKSKPPSKRKTKKKALDTPAPISKTPAAKSPPAAPRMSKKEAAEVLKKALVNKKNSVKDALKGVKETLTGAAKTRQEELIKKKRKQQSSQTQKPFTG